MHLPRFAHLFAFQNLHPLQRSARLRYSSSVVTGKPAFAHSPVADKKLSASFRSDGGFGLGGIFRVVFGSGFIDVDSPVSDVIEYWC